MAVASEDRVYSGQDLAEGELHPLGLGLAAVFTTRSPEAETTNEDSCAIIPYDDKSGILAVADGAGGLPGGGKASELAIATLRAAVRAAARKNEPLRTAILDGIEKANLAVQALGIGAATTLAVAEIHGSKIKPYHVGDSQIMVVGRMGKVKLITMSHSPVGYAMEAGLLREKDAMLHEERHLVSNLVGFPSMHIEVGPTVDLMPNDTVVIASDGLFDNLLLQEIVDTCRKGPLLAISRHLAEQSHDRMRTEQPGKPSKPDDLTFIAYRRRATTD